MWRNWLPPIVAGFVLFGLVLSAMCVALDVWPTLCHASLPRWFDRLPEGVQRAWFYLTLPGLIGMIVMSWTGTACAGFFLGQALAYYFAGWLAHGAMVLLLRGLGAMRGGRGP